MSDETSNGGGGCFGCLTFIAFCFVIAAFWVGLPTPWGTLELDMFPPAIRVIEVADADEIDF